MNPSDLEFLEHARGLESLGEILVIVGVVMEVPEIASLVCAIKKWRDEKRYISTNPARPEAKWGYALIAMVGLAVLISGLVLERRGHREEVGVLDAERDRLTKELGISETNAAEANERSKILESTNLQLRIELAQLQERTKWRQITLKQAADFKKLTAGIMNKIPVRVYIGQECPDAESYASELRDMFDEAGFKETNSEPWGVHRDPTRLQSIPLGKTNEFEDVQIIYSGDPPPTNNFQMPVDYHPEQSPPMAMELPPSASQAEVFHAINIALQVIGVKVRWDRADTWVKPGEFEIFVPCSR